MTMPTLDNVPKNSNEVILLETCELFTMAEQIIKKVERIDAGLVMPAINQLRYAGHHLTKHLLDKHNQKSEGIKALNHCKRAIYDAYEAGITYCLLELKKFQDDYKSICITPTFPDYSQCCINATEAVELIETTNWETRDEYYKQGEHYFNILYPHIKKFPTIRDELNKTIVVERKKSFCVIAGIILAAIGVIVSIAQLN